MIIQHEQAEGGPPWTIWNGTSQDVQIDKINEYETQYGISLYVLIDNK